MDFQVKEAYRNARISELVADVNAANADAWLKTMQRCASTKSNDLATFPSFGRFIEELARTKPEIVESYLDRLGEDLAAFLPAMLRGMEGTPRWSAAKQRVDQWLTQRRYLSQILWYQRFTDKIDVALFKWALGLAIEDGNDRAVMNAAEICAARSDVHPPRGNRLDLCFGHRLLQGEEQHELGKCHLGQFWKRLTAGKLDRRAD